MGTIFGHLKFIVTKQSTPWHMKTCNRTGVRSWVPFFLGQCHFLRPDMVTLPYGARSSKLELIKHQLFLWCLKIFFSHESKEAAKTVSFGAVWLNKKSITQPHTLSCFKSSQVGHFWSTHTCVSVSKHWNRYYHYTTTSSV